MKNITHLLDEVYHPIKALVVYQSAKRTENIYVEAYDMDKNGKLASAHPLSLKENNALADLFDSTSERKRDFLKSEGVLSDQVLYINPAAPGFVIWYTPSKKVSLYFKEVLDIPCGAAFVPPLLWKASIDRLELFAIPGGKKPDNTTRLYHAPFFNIYDGGRVCMGTVDIDIDNHSTLEKFMRQWEDYFWNSYFSHSMSTYCPVSVNIVQLWQDQVKTQKPFPMKVLKETGKTIRDLLI